jgi:hypothetical protein
MNTFTNIFFRKSKMSELLGFFTFFAFLLTSTLSQAQSSTTHCPAPVVMTGTVDDHITGICALCSITGPNNAGDGSLATGTSFNLTIGVGVLGIVDIRGTTTYPAGSMVTAVVENGGSGLLSNLLVGLLTRSEIQLTMNGTVVQTLNSSSGLVQVDLLGGLLGPNQGAIGGRATVQFNGAKFLYGSTVSLLSGWTMNGIAVGKGCARLLNCGSAVSSQTAYYANGNTQTTGTVTVPINVAALGSTRIGISGGGFTSPSTVYALNSGATSVTVPVTFDGTGSGGTRTITVTQYDLLSGTALTGGTCTYTVNVQPGMSVANAGPISKTSTGLGNNVTGTAATEVTPSGGITPYVYSLVNCPSGTTGSTNINTAHGSVTINQSTGAYTYTPNATFGLAGDQFCIRVCDSSSPNAGCTTITYNVSMANSTYTFACPSGALTMPSGVFVANGTAGQTGSIRIPLSGATAGAASFTLTSSSAGILSTTSPYITLLTAGQSFVDIPVTYNGSGTAGSRTITVSSPAANTTSTCNTGTVTVGAPFALGNASVAVTTTSGTPYTSTGPTTVAAISPTGGTSPYSYTLVSCATDLATTTSTQGGTVTITSGTGAYVYTPATGFVGTDTYCIKVCDASNPANCLTATYTATVTQGPVAAPTISSNPSPIVAGQPVTLTATGCTGTVTWLNNGTQIGTGSPYTVSNVPASPQANYTATCTLNSVTSNPSNTLSGPGPVSAPTVTSNPSPLVTNQSATLTATGCTGTVTWYNNGTPVGTGTPLSVASIPANSSYTATCTVLGVSSSPSTPPLTSGAGTVDAPVISSNPSPLVAGQGASLTATGCSTGTVTWFNNGAQLGTGNPYSVASVPATPQANYSATCTVAGITSSPSNIVSGPGPVSAPTVASNPSPLVTNQPASLTATGCTGTVTWYNNGTQVGTGTPLSVVSVPANSSYTATCTVLGVTSSPSTPPITSGVGTINPPTTSSNPNPLVNGLPATLTATGCAGTITWYNNGTVVGTGTTLTVPSVAPNSSYTAVCTVSGVDSNPSTPITSGGVTAPVITSNPSPVVVAQSASLSASGCNGTIIWYNGTTQVGTGTPLSIASVPSNAAYTATCTIGGVTSGNSNQINSGTADQDYTTSITSNNPGQFAAGGSKTYTVSYINTRNTAATQSVGALISGPFGYSCTGCGSVTVPALAVGQSYTVTVTLTANNAGASGTLSSVITNGSGGDSRSDNNKATTVVRTAN